MYGGTSAGADCRVDPGGDGMDTVGGSAGTDCGGSAGGGMYIGLVVDVKGQGRTLEVSME